MKARFDGSGDVLLITGGARGIGAALAAAAARSGASVVVLDVDVSGSPLAGTPGVELSTVDVADQDSVGRAVDGVVERFGRIDGLVAGAAVQPRTPVLDTDPADWARVIEVNLHGVLFRMRNIQNDHGSWQWMDRVGWWVGPTTRAGQRAVRCSRSVVAMATWLRDRSLGQTSGLPSRPVANTARRPTLAGSAL